MGDYIVKFLNIGIQLPSNKTLTKQLMMFSGGHLNPVLVPGLSIRYWDREVALS